MKTAAFILFMLLVVVTAMPAAGNPVPGPLVRVYFDENFQHDFLDCPGQIIDTLYVVAENFNTYLSAIEYQISYPTALSFLGDIIPEYPAALSIGSSPYGISIAYTIPLDAFGPALVQRVLVFWNCTNCEVCREIIEVQPHPASGRIQAVRWPDPTTFEADALRAVICPCVGTKQTTWGNVKSLYK